MGLPSALADLSGRRKAVLTARERGGGQGTVCSDSLQPGQERLYGPAIFRSHLPVRLPPTRLPRLGQPRLCHLPRCSCASYVQYCQLPPPPPPPTALAERFATHPVDRSLATLRTSTRSGKGCLAVFAAFAWRQLPQVAVFWRRLLLVATGCCHPARIFADNLHAVDGSYPHVNGTRNDERA